jgi:hypothetical protein
MSVHPHQKIQVPVILSLIRLVSLKRLVDFTEKEVDTCFLWLSERNQVEKPSTVLILLPGKNVNLLLNLMLQSLYTSATSSLSQKPLADADKSRYFFPQPKMAFLTLRIAGVPVYLVRVFSSHE